MSARIINTGIPSTDNKSKEILSSVIGQLSDGIWENSSGMVKYWQNLDVDTKDNNIVIVEDTYSPFWKYSSTERDKKVLEFFANKIKQIIKTEIDDGNDDLEWDRNCTGVSDYLGYKEEITVRDAYKVYDKLKGRKDRIKESKKPLKESYYFVDTQTSDKFGPYETIGQAMGKIKQYLGPYYDNYSRYIAIMDDAGKVYKASGEPTEESLKESKKLTEANEFKSLKVKVYMEHLNYRNEVNDRTLIAAFRTKNWADKFVPLAEEWCKDFPSNRIVVEVE